MEDRDKQREEKRTDADCQDEVSLPPREDPPVRDAKDCDDATVPPEADEFVDPNICPPEPPPELVVPDALVIGNDEYTADCPLAPDKPGDTGDSVTVLDDTFTDFFVFGEIPGINANQLTFLSGLSTAERDQLADPDTTIETIVTITHLSVAQATYINTSVSDLKDNVNAIAQTSAESQLACLFKNTEQTTTCVEAGFPVDAYTNSNVPVGQEDNVNNPSVITANTYSSTISQEEVDDIAANVAEAELLCHYGNDETTVTCLDIGFSEVVPNDVAPAPSADGRLRVGSVTIAADTIFSSGGRPAATTLASALAESQLACFYLNDQVNRACEDEDIGKFGTAATPADAAGGKSGNPVFIPPGFIQSSVSTTVANTDALALANSLLECYWVNSEQCEECDQEEVTNPDDPDGPPYYITAEEPGPVCIAAGTTRSFASQLDANEQALTLAKATLVCVYCNPQINPKCPADDWSGIVPVPLEEIDGDWSVTATRGTAAGTVCNVSAQDVVSVAVSVGNVPAGNDGDDCCYGNDAVTWQCFNDVWGNPPDYNLSTFLPITIAANTIIACDSDTLAAGYNGTTKEYATSLAWRLVVASVRCIWSNARIEGGCPLPSGDDRLLDNPTIVVAAGSFISFTGQAEADSIANAVFTAQLNCQYCNYGQEGNASFIELEEERLVTLQAIPVEDRTEEQSQAIVELLIWLASDEGQKNETHPGNGKDDTPAGMTFISQPSMEECSMLSSISSLDAANRAEDQSDAMAVYADNENLGGGGNAGNDGAQTNCDGDCFAYFS